jgi:hypothetical protein
VGNEIKMIELVKFLYVRGILMSELNYIVISPVLVIDLILAVKYYVLDNWLIVWALMLGSYHSVIWLVVVVSLVTGLVTVTTNE